MLHIVCCSPSYFYLYSDAQGLTRGLQCMSNASSVCSSASVKIHSLYTPVQFAPRSESANRTLANSLPGMFASWLFHSLAYSFLSPFALWPSRSLELLLHRIYAPRSKMAWEFLFPGTFVFKSIRSQQTPKNISEFE